MCEYKGTPDHRSGKSLCHRALAKSVQMICDEGKCPYEGIGQKGVA